MIIGLSAGEPSGDALGAGLIRALRKRFPEARFTGLAGPRMIAAGCEPLPGYERLAVMGLVEVLKHLPGLLRLRGQLVRHFQAHPPDCFIGLDAPDFNLGLERRVRKLGVPVVHYVSPSVWAWRPGRVATVAQACDRVLCLFPFEPECYAGAGVVAVYVGHPLADEIPPAPDRAAARRELQLPAEAEVVALLPGSRASEVARLAGAFAGAAGMLSRARPGVQFAIPVAKPTLRAPLVQAMQAFAPGTAVAWFDGQAQRVLAGADVTLVASGTATLEAMLCRCPLVVGYRVAPVSHFLLKNLGLLPLERYALPNILTGKDWVPELMQAECNAENLCRAALGWLDAPERADAYRRECLAWHHELKCDASEQAAAAVAQLLDERGVTA